MFKFPIIFKAVKPVDQRYELKLWDPTKPRSNRSPIKIADTEWRDLSLSSFFLFLFLMVLGIEPRALCIQSKS